MSAIALKQAIQLLDQLEEQEVYSLIDRCFDRFRIESVLRDATFLEQDRDNKRKEENGGFDK